MKKIFLFICLFIFMEEANAQCTGIAVEDSLALVALYESCGGTGWTYDEEEYYDYEISNHQPTPNLGNTWLVGNVSTWHGIVLTEDGCNVQKIFLDANGLIGNLPSELSNLNNLFVYRA